MTTIKDVAQEAGVSVATVSRLLNDTGVVHPETAARVSAAIQKLSYEPNLLARNFRRSESRVILILSPNITNPYYAHILAGIGDVFSNLGYSAVIFNTSDAPEREREALEMLKRHRADGVILMANTLSSLEFKEYADQFPLVQCSEYDPNLQLARVSIDNYLATQEAIDYLVGLGHRRIATISSENNYISTQLRMRAYQDTLQRYNISLSDEYIKHASYDYSFKSGKAKAKELLTTDPMPTAIFCISDTLALGAVIAAQELGYCVPEDVTVIGFDDVEHTTMFHPYITTVAQPCYELGRHSAELLFAQITHASDYTREVVLPHQLIIRESSAPPLILD